jgi:hypothetical protein
MYGKHSRIYMFAKDERGSSKIALQYFYDVRRFTAGMQEIRPA